MALAPAHLRFGLLFFPWEPARSRASGALVFPILSSPGLSQMVAGPLALLPLPFFPSSPLPVFPRDCRIQLDSRALGFLFFLPCRAPSGAELLPPPNLELALAAADAFRRIRSVAASVGSDQADARDCHGAASGVGNKLSERSPEQEAKRLLVPSQSRLCRDVGCPFRIRGSAFFLFFQAIVQTGCRGLGSWRGECA